MNSPGILSVHCPFFLILKDRRGACLINTQTQSNKNRCLFKLTSFFLFLEKTFSLWNLFPVHLRHRWSWISFRLTAASEEAFAAINETGFLAGFSSVKRPSCRDSTKVSVTFLNIKKQLLEGVLPDSAPSCSRAENGAAITHRPLTSFF